MSKSMEVQARITAKHAEKLRSLQVVTGMNTSQIMRALIEQAELVQQTQFRIQLNAESATVRQDMGGAFCDRIN